MKSRFVLLWSAVSLTVGMALYDGMPTWSHPYVTGGLLVAVFCLLGCIVYGKGKNTVLWGSVLFLCLMGMGRMYLAEETWRTASSWAIQSEGQYEAVLMEPPLVQQEDHYVRYLVQLEKIRYSDGEEMTLNGSAYVYDDDINKIPVIGERISVHGKLSPLRLYQNPGKIDLEGRYRSRRLLGRIYLAEGEKVHSLGDSGHYRLERWAENIKNDLEMRFAPYMDRQRLSILMTLLFGGNYNEIPEAVMTSFSTTGIVHILSVSGSHIALLFGFLYLMGKWFSLPQKVILIGSISLVIGYGLLAGLVPPVVRAAVMGILSVGGIFLEREKATLNLLGAAVTGMLLWDPFYLYDVSFQLSVGASAGLLIFYGPLLRCMKGLSFLPTWIREGTSLALAAQVLTVPIVLYDFHNFPLFFIPANLFVAPFLDWCIIAGLLAAIASLIFLPLAGGVLQSADYFLWLGLRLNFFLSSLPKAALPLGGMSGASMVGYYLTVGLLYFQKEIRASKERILTALALWSVVMATTLYLYWQTPSLRVYVPDLGPDQGMMLVNGDRNILYYKGGQVASHRSSWEWNSILGYEGIFDADVLVLNLEEVKDPLPLSMTIPVKEIWVLGGTLERKVPQLDVEMSNVRQLKQAKLAWGDMQFVTNGSSSLLSLGEGQIYLGGQKPLGDVGPMDHTLWLAGHEGFRELTEKEIQRIAPEAVIYTGNRLQQSWENRELFEVLDIPVKNTYTDGMQEVVFRYRWELVTGD